jgi:hypothetical protein
MMITRTSEAVEFQISEARRFAIDVSRVASASKIVERTAKGALVNALLLNLGGGEAPVRVEASAAHVEAMHSWITEIMSETTGPAIISANVQSEPSDQTIH